MKLRKNDPYYQGWFWCDKRSKLFRWDDFINYERKGN